MDYERWSEQYLTQAEALRSKLKTLRKDISCLKGGEQDAAYYRLHMLYEIYLELRHTGLYLKERGKRIK